MASSIVRAMASRQVAPAIAMLHVSSPSVSSCKVYLRGGGRGREGESHREKYRQGGGRENEEAWRCDHGLTVQNTFSMRQEYGHEETEEYGGQAEQRINGNRMCEE